MRHQGGQRRGPVRRRSRKLLPQDSLLWLWPLVAGFAVLCVGIYLGERLLPFWESTGATWSTSAQLIVGFSWLGWIVLCVAVPSELQPGAGRVVATVIAGLLIVLCVVHAGIVLVSLPWGRGQVYPDWYTYGTPQTRSAADVRFIGFLLSFPLLFVIGIALAALRGPRR